MAITQKHRIFAVNTPLGEDVLVFQRMTATEQLGRLFEFELEMLSERTDLDLAEMLGKNVTVRMELPEVRGGETRYFNGFVTRFSSLGILREESYGVYRATLSPWLWFLTRTSDCRIFQQKKVPEIIESIFQEHGFTDFKKSLSGDYRTWEYCVQYRETDFNFVSRLMEQEGIYYYFTHSNGKHMLVLADGLGSHDPFPNYDEIPFYPPDLMENRERDHIYQWVAEKQVQPGAYALNDFDFIVPDKKLRSRAATRPAATPGGHAMDNFEMYDYPGEYSEKAEGDSYTGIRLEELLAQHEILQGEGVARGLAAGCLFGLTNCARDEQNRQYLIVSVIHELRGDFYETVAGAEAPPKVYQARITAIDAQQPYRAPRITPKPVVRGPQTAIVVGPSGEEIYTDQYGRVKCQFHWDRYGKADQDSSCWIRVAQSMAGKKWGALYLPRIGHEVIVDFLEGDPDQPIITGRVYNGKAMPPYDLPAEQTKSTFKSLSSKGGGGFNEFRFDDKKGEEQIFIHAEKDQHNRVKKDTLEWVGQDRHLIVICDQFEEVKGDKHLSVKGDQNEKIDGTVSLETGMDLQEKVGMKHALDAGMEIHLKAGMNVIIEAGMSITLKAGGGFVVVGPAGVTISGTPVLINSGGSAGSGSGSSPEAPKAPKEADQAEPGGVTEVQATPIAKSARQLDSVSVGGFQNPQAQTLANAARDGTPFCEKCEETR
ncbi:MAG: type VI secretion system tip protein VgrG [Candidatus Competibacteraceae bacterium]